MCNLCTLLVERSILLTGTTDFVVSFLRFMDIQVLSALIITAVYIGILFLSVIREGCPDLATQLKQTPDAVIDTLGLAMHQVQWNNGRCREGNLSLVNSIGTRDLC